MKRLFKISVILILILSSGSVFFALKYGKIFKVLLAFMAFIIFMINLKKIKINSIKSVLIFNILILISTIINIKYKLNLVSVLTLMIVLASIPIIQSYYTKSQFKEMYIKIICFLSISSLICFGLNYFKIYTNFPFSKYEIIGTCTYHYSFYHTWGWDNDFPRNAGLFWEPGAFQAFINFALLMIFFSKDISIKGIKNRYSAILIVTLLTTQSTTGYLIFCIILIYYIVLNNKKRIQSIIITPIVIIFMGLFVLSSEVVVNKLTLSNASTSIRVNDLTTSIELIKDRPLVGNGYGNDDETIIFQINGIQSNSNGIAIFIYRFGIIFGIIYIVLYYQSIKDLFDTDCLTTLVILFIFIIIFSTEDFVLKPMFLTLLYKNYDNKCAIKMKRKTKMELLRRIEWIK